MSNRHPELYFDDGTLTFKAADGTLYNVYRHNLIVLSDCFNGMLTLPIPDHPAPSESDNAKVFLDRARAAGLDGTSDATAVPFPTQFSSTDCERFLEFVFNTHGWSAQVPPLDNICAILRTCHFFAVETGVDYAIHHLENHPELGAALRFRMGRDYHIASWITQGFDDLMCIPINKLSLQDETLLGWDTLWTLAKTQAAVLDHRLNLAICPPAPTHVSWCHNEYFCTTEWEKAWVSRTGILGMLLREELPGSVIHDALDITSAGAMTGECRILTCNKIREAEGRMNDLKKEEYIIDDALAGLAKTLAVSLT
ncbi:hypothetical protein C8R47DRAFT_1252012 [Mycena vitilis]|nr:hypothetical protein C8R47DRAFT_1252012 [Mycena vitilis]